MIKASELSVEEAIRALTENNDGILLVQEDKASFLTLLSQEYSYEETLTLIGKEKEIDYQLFPVMCHKQKEEAKSLPENKRRIADKYIKVRVAAMNTIPKLYSNILEEQWKETDYVLLRKEDVNGRTITL